MVGPQCFAGALVEFVDEQVAEASFVNAQREPSATGEKLDGCCGEGNIVRHD